MRVLGIETSCDENSVAVVQDGHKLLSNVVFSQVDLHKTYGGVVPEVAARSHIEVMTPTIEAALEQAFGSKIPSSKSQSAVQRTSKSQSTNSKLILPRGDTTYSIPNTSYWHLIDAIAVAHGPGLGGSLLIGTLAARTLALVKGKPLYGVHHALGHIYANFIDWRSIENRKMKNEKWQEPKFPVLALVVSGGHSHLVHMKSHGEYELIGQTRDDAAGEAFDKVAKILGLDYPGGPAIQAAADGGDANFLQLPKAAMAGFDYSFSGLKTAVLRAVQDLVGVQYDFPSYELKNRLSSRQVKDIAASFQRVLAETLVDTLLAAYQRYEPKTVVIAGGVAANAELRRQLKNRLPIEINYAPISLCTDNGAMIAALGYFAAQHRQPDDIFKLDILPSLTL